MGVDIKLKAFDSRYSVIVLDPVWNADRTIQKWYSDVILSFEASLVQVSMD